MVVRTRVHARYEQCTCTTRAFYGALSLPLKSPVFRLDLDAQFSAMATAEQDSDQNLEGSATTQFCGDICIRSRQSWRSET